MPTYLCRTCGVAYRDAAAPPAECRICLDERQYVGHGGQSWTTLAELRRTHANRFDVMEDGIVRVGTQPDFGIGQHAFVVRTPQGNVLWDCVALIDDATRAAIEALGGLRAIALSHPHYYSTIDLWSDAFDAPVHIHEADEEWIVRPPARLELWRGSSATLFGGLTLVHGPGHFAGSAMLHWAAGADGRGVLFAGDTVQVVMDPRWVSFMYSYPNLIPLSIAEVDGILAALEPLPFDRIYSPWRDRVVETDAKEVLARSRDRYAAALAGPPAPNANDTRAPDR